MRTHTAISKKNLRITIVVLLLLVLLVGCNDSTTSPCYDCVPVPGDGKFTDVAERQFAVGDGAVVSVDNFAGRVTWRTGDAGTVRVRATRRAAHRSDLDCIELSMAAREGRLDITTDNPTNLKKASVDLEITGPADALPRIATGVGNVDYKGRPIGICRFGTGVGSIRLRLPDDVDITVELRVAVGSIYSAFPVDGMVSSQPNVVRGKIGQGREGELRANAAVGNIRLLRW
jgi:hypothetical protein